MKPFYMHNNEKVTIPVCLCLDDIEGYLDVDDVDAIEAIGFGDVDLTLTIVRDRDIDSGIPWHYEISDVDVCTRQLSGSLIFYKDMIIRACEGWVIDNEDKITSSDYVESAFARFDRYKAEVRRQYAVLSKS